MLILLTLLACGPGEPPWAGPELVLSTEPTLRAEGELTLENRWTRDILYVEAIELLPEEAPGRVVRPEADWEVPPGETRSIRVRFDPEEVGTWDARVVFSYYPWQELEVPVQLVAEVGEDPDGDDWSEAMGDCDPEDGTVYPGAPELCDGLDNDCDEKTDEDFDADYDGHLSAELCPGLGDDCNDNDRTAYPGREEECDGTDSDCNGVIDDLRTLADRQEGMCEGLHKVCVNPFGISEPDYRVLPGFQYFERACDGIDNDCDGTVDEFDWRGDGTSDCTDDDGDGLSEAEGDCHDDDPELGPEDCTTRLAVTSMYEEWGLRIHHLDLDWEERVEVWQAGPDGPELGPTYGSDQVRALGMDRVIFTNQEGGDVVLVDLWDREVDDAVSFSGDTGTYDLLLDGDSVWVGLHDRGLISLSLKDLGDEEAMVSTGELLASRFTRHGDWLWGCGHLDVLSGEAWRYNLLDGTWEDLDLGFGCSSAPVVDTAGQQVLYSNYQEQTQLIGQIGRVDLSTGEVLDIVPLPWWAYRMHLTDEGLWVASGVDDRATLYDLDTWELVVDLGFPDETSVHDVWVDEERGHLWLTLYGANLVMVVDMADWTEITRYYTEAPDFLEPLP